MLGTVVGRRTRLESDKPRLESRTCCLLSHLTSDKFLNVLKFHFPICKMGIIIPSIILHVDLLLYLVTVVIVIGASEYFCED